jgi:hypothetical protein
MDPLTLGLLCFFGGLLVGGGTMFGIKEADNKNTAELVEAIGELKTPLADAQGDVMRNMTDQDLLKEACSTAYLKEKGDSLCREMFCRMQNRGLDKGATTTECENISHITNAKSMLGECMQYWGDDTILTDGGFNKNSKFAVCMDVFEDRE